MASPTSPVDDVSKVEAQKPVTEVVDNDDGNARVVDAVFGALSDDSPNYRDVGWLGTIVLMMKTQIGLGVLSIPFVLSTLGAVPGVICLLAIAIITTWSDYVVGQFKLNHPEVYSIADVGQILAGRIGREVMAIGYWLLMTTIAGSAMLSVSIALNAVSVHGTCTAAFVAIAAILGFAMGSIQTLGKITWLTWVGLISVCTSILVVTVAVGIQDRPSAAPATGPWDKDIRVFGDPTFAEAMSAIGSLIFAYAGVPAFFPIISEMRDPRRYTRSMLSCQALVTAFYLSVGIVVYYFCGQYVASPALGSAGPLLKRVCYGLALPGLLVTVVLYSHLPAKYIFVRVLRHSRHLSSNTKTHWIVWLSCTGGCVFFSYIIASAIPVFGGLVSLVGALFGTMMSIQPMGCMWLYDHWHLRHTNKTLKYRLLAVWNISVIMIGNFLLVAGTYGAILDIKSSYSANGGTRPWSCADNSNST